MHGEAFLKERVLRSSEPRQTENTVEDGRHRAADRIKSNGGEDEETNKIEQQALRMCCPTSRNALHDALPCRDQQIDADPAPESGSKGVRPVTARQIKRSRARAMDGLPVEARRAEGARNLTALA